MSEIPRTKSKALLARRREQVRRDGVSAGASTTSDVGMLVIEAQFVDGMDMDETYPNIHIPSNDNTLDAAVEQIEERGLVPAWEVVSDE